MLDGFITGLVVAWILSLFGVDKMVVEVLQPFTKVLLTSSHYYMGFALIGLIGAALSGK